MSDEHQGDAFGALRERWDGEAPEAEAEATLRAALIRTRKKRQSRTAVRWIAMPLAAALCVATAWAATTGRGPFERKDARSGEQASPIPASPGAAVPTPMPTRDEPAAAALAAGTPATSAAATSAAATSAEQPPARQAPAVAAVTAAPVTAHSASEPSAAESPPPPEDPSAALFAEAHKLHFVHKDPARALAAWDAYLRAAPDGRFAPEARYNRALTLLRLGRNKEAREALEPFASGAFGTYRRDDARALLDALDR